MGTLFYFASGLFIFTSCSSSRNYFYRMDDDRTLFEAVKSLNKHPDDSEAIKALPVLYAGAGQRHLDRIRTFNSSKDIARWDKIVDEYNVLQRMYDAISESATANGLVRPVNYQSIIYDLRQQAAEDYYNQAGYFMNGTGRTDARNAYNYYKKADKWVPGYYDTKTKINDAYNKAIVNVVISRVRDNGFYLHSGWGDVGSNYSAENFNQTMVRELGGRYATRYPARFYTEYEATREGVQPDWVVEISLRNLDIPYPYSSSYTRSLSKQVEVGRDTSSNLIYQTVYGTLYITRESLTARAEMELDITELSTHKNLIYKTFREEYSWQEEHASFDGDNRVLGPSDWNLLGNNRFNEPRNEEMPNLLCGRLYPRVKNQISTTADW